MNDWDSWRADDGPWMVTLRFIAGGRERVARWGFDPTARTVTPQDDEALWLSEDEKPPAAPLAAPHLSAVPTVTAVPPPLTATSSLRPRRRRRARPPDADTMEAPSAVDLVGAMRQRRHGRRRQSGSRPGHARRPGPRQPRPSSATAEQEPLELEPLTFDPTLLGDPPAAAPVPVPERLRDPSGRRRRRPPPQDASDRPAPSRLAPRPAVERGTAAAAELRPRSARRPGSRRPRAAAGGPTAVRPQRRRPAPATGARDGPACPSWDEIMFGGKRD